MSELGVITPSPILTPNSSPYTLSEQINAATRPTHSQLNRLIVARLPLALPPHASNPTTYLTGIIHIASIYATFEQLWQTILDAQHLPTTLNKPLSFDACDPDSPLIDSNTDIPLLQHRPRVCTRTHSLLTHLHLPGLLRTGRIRADIRVLSGLSDHEIDERIKEVTQNGPLANFIVHIKHSVETNPHVLLAYAWVLYMALFSGGRYLRQSLHAAGPAFWDGSQSASPFAHLPNPFLDPPETSSSSSSHGPGERDRRASRSENSLTSAQPVLRKLSRSDNGLSVPLTPLPGLHFFNFLGEEDGEDIKLEFKKRIAEAEILLTSGEKDDVVQEAQEIFKFMIELVHQLYGICNTFPPKEDETDSGEESTGSVVKTSLKKNDDDSSDSVAELLDIKHGGKHARAFMRSRDSVAVNHARIRKRNDTVTEKDSVHPGELLKRSTTISFKGHERKSSMAVVTESFQKIVRWGGCETVQRKLSTQVEGVRRLSTVTWKDGRGRVIMASAVVVLAVMVWWLLCLFGLLR